MRFAYSQTHFPMLSYIVIDNASAAWRETLLLRHSARSEAKSQNPLRKRLDSATVRGMTRGYQRPERLSRH